MEELLANNEKPALNFDEYVQTRRETFQRKMNKLAEEQDKLGVVFEEHGQVFLRLGNELSFNEALAQAGE